MVKKAQAGIELTADMQKLQVTLEKTNKLFVDLDKGAVKSASGIKVIEKTADAASVKLGFMAGIVTKLKTALQSTFGRLVAGAALVSFGKSVIGASSALTELDSKARVVFGNTFGMVEKRVGEIAEEVGRAKSAILQFSADLGAVIQAAGITGDRLADMSTELAKLSVDLASFHNTSDIQAFNALRSAITGELEPLKRFGVVMTQANLSAFALNKGVKQNIDTMNQAQLTALRYSYILDRTETAQGDAARTADSFANRTRRLQGNWQELMETIGNAGFIDAASQAVGALSLIVDGLTRSIQRFVSETSTGMVYLLQAIGFETAGLKKYENDFGVRGLEGLAGEKIRGRDLTRADVDRLAPIVSQNKATKEAEAAAKLREEIAALGGAGTGKGGGGGGSDKAKQEAERAAKEEEERIKTIVEENKKLMTLKREELKLKKEMGELTDKEERTLQRINNRIEFSTDAIADATDEWRDQKRALDEIEDKISDINDKILEEQSRLQDSIAQINDDAAKDRTRAFEDLLKERDEFEGKLRRVEGLSLAERERYAEVEGLLGKYGKSNDLAEAEDLFGSDPIERINKESEAKIKAAQEEGAARLKPLQDELAQAERNRDATRALETEKKNIVLQMLAEREAITYTAYEALETRLKTHVDTQVAEYARLQAAVYGMASFEASQLTAFEGEATGRITAAAQAAGASARIGGTLRRAGGGPIIGPGTGTSDSILMWGSNGEFMQRKKAVDYYGLPFMKALNELKVPKFANGGPINNNNARTANITVHNHGEAARTYNDPTRQRWRARTMLG